MSALQVDTAAMLAAADAFDQLHARAEKALTGMRRDMADCRWASPAGDQTKQAYAAFQDKYTERYLGMLHNYALFLRELAAEGYEQTENANVTLADLLDEDVGVTIRARLGGVQESANRIVSHLAAELK